MNDTYDDIKIWHAKAWNFMSGSNGDKVHDSLMLAALLRLNYLLGKKDGVTEYNDSER